VQIVVVLVRMLGRLSSYKYVRAFEELVTQSQLAQHIASSLAGVVNRLCTTPTSSALLLAIWASSGKERI
jgi:hypothetical protein